MNAHVKEAGPSLLSQAILIALMDQGLGRSEAYVLVQKAALSSQRDFKQALIEAGIYNFLSELEICVIIAQDLVIGIVNIYHLNASKSCWIK